MSSPTRLALPKLGSENFIPRIPFAFLLPGTRETRVGRAPECFRNINGAEHTVLVRNLETQRQQNLALCVEAARSSRFNTINRQRGKTCFPREFCLAHHEVLSEPLNLITGHRSSSETQSTAVGSDSWPIGLLFQGLEAPRRRFLVRRITSDTSAIESQVIAVTHEGRRQFPARKRFQTCGPPTEKKVMFDRILVIDDDDAFRESLEMILSAEGYTVRSAHCGEAALAALDDAGADLVLCDLRMPGIDGFDLLPQISRRLPGVPIILMSAHGTEDLAVEAIQRGAYDYLAKPFQPSELRLTLRKAHEREQLRHRNELLQREMSRSLGDRAIVAASDGMINLLEMLDRTAGYKSTVLVTGESGTGKEVIARAIHSQSTRREAPFIAVNCGAIPENLLESELFGHAKGAFTGANRAHRGLFAEAHEGTLFLDEIAEMPTSLQVKLLRAIQEEEIRPVGDTKSTQIDVRVIAATARDLEKEIETGRFREDLFYRLNVVRLEVPPLRERREDIPLLVDHFLSRFREQLGKNVRSVADDALEQLVAYAWPGNVRELENLIERAVILSDGDTVEASALPAVVGATPRPSSSDEAFDAHEDFCLKRARQAFEAKFIRRALVKTGGNRTHAAKLLEVSHRALLYKIKDYGIRD